MNEEKRMILKMVEDEKITPEQAVELLNAVREKPATEHDQASESKSTSNIKDHLGNEFKSSLRGATIAGKEALQTIKETVQSALEENRTEIGKSEEDLVDESFERVAQIDEELAREYKQAEQEFTKAKASFRGVEALSSSIEAIEVKIAELNQLEDLSVEQQQVLRELKTKLVEASGEKERMHQESKNISASAQEKMLAVRRKLKDKGVNLEDLKVKATPPSAERIDFADLVTKATSQIGPFVNQLIETFNIAGGVEHLVVESFNWTPEDKDQNVVINTNLQNGSVKIYSEEEREEIYVKINKRIKAEEENVAEIAKDIVNIKQAGNIVSIEVIKKFSNRHSVSVEVYLPQKYTYDCNLKSVNGSIALDQVKGDAFLISTTNGKIKIDGGSANHVQAGSTNGSLRSSISAKVVNLKALNGSIRHYVTDVSKSKVDLSTTNGSIRVYLGVEACTAVNAKSRVGSVKLVDGDWYILQENKNRVGKALSAAQVGCDFDSAPIQINAKTSQGSIRVIKE